MIKLLTPCALIALILSACAQRTYYIRVDFKNVCQYPVDLIASHYSNFVSLDDSVQQRILPEEVVTIVSVGSFSGDACDIPDKYTLAISANNKNVDLNKEQFLKLLEKTTSHGRFWHYIYSEGDPFHTWTISDPSLCP
jgi:hypothetical protein